MLFPADVRLVCCARLNVSGLRIPQAPSLIKCCLCVFVLLLSVWGKLTRLPACADFGFWQHDLYCSSSYWVEGRSSILGVCMCLYLLRFARQQFFHASVLPEGVTSDASWVSMAPKLAKQDRQQRLHSLWTPLFLCKDYVFEYLLVVHMGQEGLDSSLRLPIQ